MLENTENSETFVHNSCKKVAQLVKVITVTEGEIIDSIKLIQFYQDEYETIIEQTSSEYLKQLSENYDSLVQFRKSKIDEYCDFFGQHYKDLKDGISDPYKSRIEYLDDVFDKLKVYSGYLIKLKNSVIETNSTFGQNIANFYDSIETHIHEYRNDISDSKANITKKYQDNAKRDLKNINNTISNINKESLAEIDLLNGEINSVYPTEVRKKMDTLRDLKRRLGALRSAVNLLEMKANEIIHFKKMSSKNYLKKKHDIIRSVHDQTTGIIKMISHTNNKIVAGNKNFEMSLTKCAQSLTENKIRYSLELEEMLKKIKRTIDDSQISKTNNDEYIKKLQIEHKTHHETLRETLRERLKEVGDFSSQTKKLIREEEHNLKKIYRKIHATNSGANKILKEYRVKFVSSNNCYQREYQSILKSELSDFLKLLEGKTDLLAAHLSSYKQNSYAEIQELKKQNDLLRSQYNALKESNINEINEKTKNNYICLNEQKEDLNKLVNEKSNDVIKRLEEYQKSRSLREESVKNNFSKDLYDRRCRIEKKNEDSRINVVHDFEKECNEHQQQKQELEEELQRLDEALERAKLHSKDAIRKLDTIISNTDKQLRKVKRHIIAERQAINDENERSIQVEEVKLNTHIENMSKLYSGNENKVAMNIHDSLRKVHQMENKMNDLILSVNQEIAKFRNEKDIKIKNLSRQINNYKNDSDHNHINSQIEFKLLRRRERIKLHETETSKMITKLEEQIAETVNNIESTKFSIKQQIEDENIAYQTKVNEYSAKLLSIDKETPKKNIELMIEREMEKQGYLHSSDMKYTNSQIDDRRENQRELISSKLEEIEQKLSNDKAELEHRSLNIGQNIRSVIETFKATETELDGNLATKYSQNIESIINYFVCPQRKHECDKIYAKKFEIKSSQEKFVNLFEYLSDIINCSVSHKVSEPSSEKRSSSGRLKRLLSCGSRVEPKFHAL